RRSLQRHRASPCSGDPTEQEQQKSNRMNPAKVRSEEQICHGENNNDARDPHTSSGVAAPANRGAAEAMMDSSTSSPARFNATAAFGRVAIISRILTFPHSPGGSGYTWSTSQSMIAQPAIQTATPSVTTAKGDHVFDVGTVVLLDGMRHP